MPNSHVFALSGQCDGGSGSCTDSGSDQGAADAAPAAASGTDALLSMFETTAAETEDNTLLLDLAPPADHVAGRWALALVVVAETGRQPVDNPDTHLELTMIHEGPVLEYAGREFGADSPKLET